MNHNRVSGFFEDSHLPKKSTEGDAGRFDFDREPHNEFEGSIIHELSPEQAAKLPIHEAAKLFPIQESDFARLKKSINQFGQQIPVVLYEDMVLDGRCRTKACIELRKSVRVVRFSESDFDGIPLKQWVLSRNRSVTDGRRMTDAQYALIVATAYGREESELARLRQMGGLKLDGALCGETSKILGATFDISSNLMKQALKLLKSGDEELLELVRNKGLSISRAAEISSLPETERKAALKNPRQPLPPSSPDAAIKAFRRALKSLETAFNRTRDVTECEHFGADLRSVIQPSLKSLQDAICQLQETQPAQDAADAEQN